MADRDEPLRAIFAPDWRNGVPYQRLLAEALAGEGVSVSFLQHYRRVFPLWRLLRAAPPGGIVHLHWPEAYYPRKGDAWDWFRAARFPFDLRQAIRGRTLAVTAHNLHTHNRAGTGQEQRNTRAAFHMAGVVFAHSEPAKVVIHETFAVPLERITVIPHGDLSVVLGPPLPRAEARVALGLGPEPLCLIFGAVEPYKGIEEVLEFWRAYSPACRLAIVGKPCTPEYGAEILRQASGLGAVEVRLGWLSDEQLREWLSAADGVLFNYREIFTSGAANLARAYGVPQLVPARLETVVLGEPVETVRRFSDTGADLAAKLREMLAVLPSYERAAAWRAETSWARVAALTAAAYRKALRPA